MSRIVALCGGVGGAKLAFGLARILPPGALSVIVNTGDDFEHLGLPISPDIDTVLYTTAGIENKATGWGRADETWSCLEELKHLGRETWFQLGDKDLALHLTRQHLLSQGQSLSEVTAMLAGQLGIAQCILPMTDGRVRTIVETDEGALAFQDYFVRRRCEPVVKGFHFDGATAARPTDQVLAALSDPTLAGIIICPSNPFVSIGPILALDEIHRKLEERKVPLLAVSPIIGGKALKGPAGKMLAELDFEVSAHAIARHYKGLIDGFVIDAQDRHLAPEIEHEGVKSLVADTIMTDDGKRIGLARACLDFLETIPARC